MIECLIWVLVVTAGAIILLWVLSVVLTALGFPLPANLMMVLRVIAALVVLLVAWRCLAPHLLRATGP